MIRILLVDDDALMLQGFRFSIDWEKHGYEIAGTLRNPESFMEIYRQLKPDIIILDINMPGLSGLDLLKELRKDNKELVVIIVSAYNEFSYAREALRLGANDYLLKAEIEFEDILAAMDRYKTRILENQRHFSSPGPAAVADQLVFQFGEAYTVFDMERCEAVIARIFTLAQKNQLSGDDTINILLLLYDKIYGIYTSHAGSFPVPRHNFKSGLVQCRDILLLRQYFTEFFSSCSDSLFEKLYCEKQSLLPSVTDYVLAHLSDPDLTLQKAAKEVNVSYYYLSRLFASEKGINFSKYVTALRMKQATEYLLHSDEHINVIAEKTGYQNLSYFIKKFKEYTGYTPKEYQKNQKTIQQKYQEGKHN